MAATTVLLLQLLISLASASHHFGGRETFTNRGRNPDGTYNVEIRTRSVFTHCGTYGAWSCHGSSCTSFYRNATQIAERQTSDTYWCETERVTTTTLRSNKPLERRNRGCCWIHTRNGYGSWYLRTRIDLGTRSDTRQPNRSPDLAVVPFLRVPENCPRSYNIMAFDPDQDRVRCRYGNIRSVECHWCNQHSGFHLDQDTCTLYYNNTYSSTYAFELVVEDFPQRHITLSYDDGSHVVRAPLTTGSRNRRSHNTWWNTTSTTPSGSNTSSSAPTITTSPYTTTTSPYTTTTSPHTTTTSPYTTTTSPYTTTTSPYTTTTSPYTTTTSPYTTTTAPYTTTTSPYTTTTSPYTTTTSPYTTTTAPYTTTTSPYTTTTAPYTTTTAPYTTTTSPYTTTTAPYTTTTAPHTTTTAPRTTTTAAHIRSSTYTTGQNGPLPLSQLPLQFSFRVDPAVHSCTEGVFLPKFLYPTPANGARLQAEVNREMAFRVKAEATHATIEQVLLSGPVGTTKHRNTHNEFDIRWTPQPEDLGHHFPICFVVEAVEGSRVYQSEMRCVLVDVSNVQVQSHVICHESSMTVMVEKASFPRLHEDHLQLNDPSNTLCSLQTHSNNTHIIGVVPLNACGTQIEEDDDYLMFKNEITTVDNHGDLITRKHLLEVKFYCQYPKRGNVTQSFLTHRKTISVWDRGFGHFTYQFEFYPNTQYNDMIDPNSYPLEYDLGSRIYMQIQATSSINNTVLFVESCRAAPYDNPNYHPVHSLIENGCLMDPTIVVYPSPGDVFRFSVEAFKFIGLHDQVYISCSVMMCEAGNSNTRCSRGCINPTQPGHQRRRRETVIQSASHFVSQGPLRLRRAAESRESTVAGNLNLNMVFIAGCLLAAVGMVCGVVLYKAKMSKIKYQPLPSHEI